MAYGKKPVAKKSKPKVKKFKGSGATGLYATINKKRNRIAKGSGETMRKPGSQGAPTDKAFKQASKTAKKPRKRTT